MISRPIFEEFILDRKAVEIMLSKILDEFVAKYPGMEIMEIHTENPRIQSQPPAHVTNIVCKI